MTGPAAHGTNASPNARAFKRRIPRPNLAGWGIVGREIMAAIPVYVTAGLIGLGGWFITLLNYLYDQDFILPEKQFVTLFWIVGFYLLCMVLGLLCGAEEQENNTEDYLRTLPISAFKHFGHKILGCLLGLIIWNLIVWTLILVTHKLFNVPGFLNTLSLWIKDSHLVAYAMIFGSLMFCVCLAVSTWIGKVILSFFVSMVLLYFLIFRMLTGMESDSFPDPKLLTFTSAVCAVCLVIAGAHYWQFQIPIQSPSHRGRRHIGFGTGGIVWKDMRERRVLVLGGALATVLAPIGMVFYLGHIEQKNYNLWIFQGSSIFAICLLAIPLGMLWLSKHDYEPQTAFLETLPVGRWRIWALKMQALLFDYGILFAVTMAIVIATGALIGEIKYDIFSTPSSFADRQIAAPYFGLNATTFKHYLFYYPLCILGFTLPVMLFTANFSLFVRSRVLCMLLSPILLVPVLGRAVALGVMTGANDPVFGFWTFFSRAMLLSAVLAGWLGFAYAKTPLRELPGWQRGIFLVLFLATLHEVYVLLIHPWRDLIFLVFGI